MTPRAKIALAPIIGAPDQIAQQIQSTFTSTVGQQRVSVATAKDEKVDYTLRGYIVAAKEKASTKVSYIWDVTDPHGQRVNRITGEELVPGGAAKDPWAAVTPAISQSIATKAANSFVAWLPAQTGQVPVATNGAQVPAGVGAQAQPVATASAPEKRDIAAAAPVQTTGSLGGGSIVATIPAVIGAPGDGTTSLTDAIHRELKRHGVTTTGQASATNYKVEGKVSVGPAKDGKQPIQIDWTVKDPQGKKLGTVSQKNEIPEGSLDGSWGKTADAAAAAAAQGIVKLLPANRAVN